MRKHEIHGSSRREKNVIKFVREDQLATEFKKLPETSEGIMIAAPFWGVGAAKMLGLAKRKKIKVLCTFDALTCNPSELAALRLAGAEIRSNPRLHAKIYCAGGFAIVGSSNPSRYGLTQEGDILSGSVEGNILTDDEVAVQSAKHLMEDLWQDPKTTKISDHMIESEIQRRTLLPKQFVRRTLNAKTLLAACRESPELFDTVFVVAYAEPLGAGGKTELRQLQAQAKAAPIQKDPQTINFKNCWAYQFEDAPPSGSWLIALDCKGKEPVVKTASQVPSPLLVLSIPGEFDLFPTIRGVVSVPGAAGNFKISKQEKAQLGGVAEKLNRMSDFVPLRKAVALIDKRGKV